jgi:hypothetical protein
MPAAFVKSAKGTSTSSSVAWAFGSATTSGNLIVGIFASDDYNGTPDSGWTQSAEMEQQAWHGSYIWWRISTGETTPQAYTIGSATNSAWVLLEFSGVDATPYDTSQGVIANTYSEDSLTMDPVTPTTGGRLLVAAITGSHTADISATSISGWTNSFTGVDSIGSGGTGTNDCAGAAYRLVTGDGSTTYATAATYGAGNGMGSRGALIISFIEAAGGGGGVSTAWLRA